jgi:murein DD-endopeptidase MepM/ murein hydrolase activator NlpD
MGHQTCLKGTRTVASAFAGLIVISASNAALADKIVGPDAISAVPVAIQPAARSLGSGEFKGRVEPILESFGTEQLCAPGLTVAPAPTDRHALQDVGGRLDVTKAWRPNIPDPVNGSSQYRKLTGATVIPVAATTTNSETVATCVNHLSEIVVNRAPYPTSHQLAYSRMGQFGGSVPSLLWASSSLSASLPVAAIIVTSGFGMRYHPILHTVREHDGVDLAAPIGTPVFATQDGIVRMADRFGGYGLFIDLDNGAGLQTRYGHMSRLNVALGQRVHKGQLIGFVGSTGLSTGPHLHYEVRYNGQPVNPLFKLRR